MAKAGYEASNAIPETNLAPLDKNMYQTVGRVPGMAAEFCRPFANADGGGIAH